MDSFRTEHSSEYAALELIYRVIAEMDNDKIPFSLFLDLSKAFDTLDHTILLEKLKYYGVDRAALGLFKSYLKDRKQYIDIDGTSSEMSTNNNRGPTGFYTWTITIHHLHK